MSSAELARLVGRADVAVVTPAWDEPFGLVVAEALACGTPVAAIGRGGVRDLIADDVGVVVHGEDPGRLAAAIGAAAGLDRRACRRPCRDALRPDVDGRQVRGVVPSCHRPVAFAPRVLTPGRDRATTHGSLRSDDNSTAPSAWPWPTAATTCSAGRSPTTSIAMAQQLRD